MTVTLDITTNVYGGDGLGRLGDGRVVFVPGVFAGETIRAEITEQKRSFVRAKCVEIVKRSPDRIEPENAMPGMVYAALSYAAELRTKEGQLGNFLQKLGLSFPRIRVWSGASANYRNKATYHVQRVGGAWQIGYRKEFSHEVIDTPVDSLALPPINAELPSIRSGLHALLTQGARGVRRETAETGNVTVRYTPVNGVKWWLGDAPAGLVLTEKTCGLDFKVAADGFYQVNPATGDKLVAAVREAYLENGEAAPNILDLYCGVGVFGICCAKAAPAEWGVRLVGAESVRSAVAFAKENAAAAGVKGSFFCERVGASLRRLKAGPRHTIIVDPPRGGLERGVPQWLAASGAARIFYVSCDPATLARDLQPILRNYRVTNVQLFDMFPRTARFETFVSLKSVR